MGYPVDITEAWSVDRLAEAVGHHPKTIQAACRRGEIGAIKVFAQWRIPANEARRVIQGHRLPGEADAPPAHEIDTPVIVFNEHGHPRIKGAWFAEMDGAKISYEIDQLLSRAYSRWKSREQCQIDADALSRAIGGAA